MTALVNAKTMKTNYWVKFSQEACYHIYNRSVGRELLFRENDNYVFFLNKWNKYLGSYCSTYAYCLMPNHFHFLIKCRKTSSDVIQLINKENSTKSKEYIKGKIEYTSFIESQFKRFFNSYSAAYNKKYNRTGSLFQAKFKRVSISDIVHFKYMLWYIHHNVIHHNIAEDYNLWPHTSYHAYLDQKSPNISIESVLKIFNKGDGKTGLENFIKFHNDYKSGPRKIIGMDDLKKLNIDT